MKDEKVELHVLGILKDEEEQGGPTDARGEDPTT
jgi:hypothetical protein